MKRLISIWKDPVWSKIISAFIIYLAVQIFSMLKGYTIFEALSFLHSIGVTYIVVCLMSIYFYIQFNLYKSNKKKNILKTFDSQEDTQACILAKWKVIFAEDNNPRLINLAIYCTNHPTMIRMIDNSCPYIRCKNHRKFLNTFLLKNHIQSDLEDRWQQISNS